MHSSRIYVWAAAAAVAIVAAAAAPPAAAADGWTRTLGPLRVGRAAPAMVELKDGRVLAIGGLTMAGASPAVDVYDPATNSWSPAARLLEGRSFASAVRLADGRVLVTGGEGWDMEPLASTEIYDPATGTWTSGAPLPAARRNPAAVTLADGRVLIAGGEIAIPDTDFPGDFFVETTRSTTIYDPASDRWTPGPSMSARRHSTALVTLKDGRILAVGGIGGGADGQQSVAAAETLDALATRWSAAGASAVGQTFGAVVRLADGRVLLAGGATANGSLAFATSRAHVFDPATGAWTEVPRMSAARGYPGYGVLPGGTAMVVGGAAVDDTLLASAEQFDPATNTWSPAPSLDAPRYAPGSLTTASGRIMLVGGIFAGEFDYLMYDDGFTYRVNQGPVAVATLVAAGAAVPNGEGLVRVSAAGSSDADGDALTFTWSKGTTVLTTTTSEAAALGLGIGTHAVTLTVSDADGAQATANLTVTVLDATAPFAQQIADLSAANAALAGDNAQLTSQVAQLTTQNGRLVSDNALLANHVAELTEQLRNAQQNNGARAAINALNVAVELAMQVRFRNPSFQLPGSTPEQKLASVIVASLTTSQGCQQQIFQTLGGRK